MDCKLSDKKLVSRILRKALSEEPSQFSDSSMLSNVFNNAQPLQCIGNYLYILQDRKESACLFSAVPYYPSAFASASANYFEITRGGVESDEWI